jgi:hypothetical protein
MEVGQPRGSPHRLGTQLLPRDEEWLWPSQEQLQAVGDAHFMESLSLGCKSPGRTLLSDAPPPLPWLGISQQAKDKAN